MHTATLRQVGGSVMVALPPAFLDQLNLKVRSSVGITIEDQRIVIEPRRDRPRYTLAELLAQCDSSAPLPAEDAEWVSSGPVGDEVL